MKKLFALVLALALGLGCLPLTLAAGANERGCLVLGEDLSAAEREKVLEFLKVDHPDDYQVSYTSNRQEHAALDDYLGADVVGSRALSSILLLPRKEGEGISVSSYNITYCTVEMYRNALISAGVKDVSVSIAAPVPVSGTCALLGAMNAYSLLSGEEIDEKKADAALEELVTTGDVGELLGDKDTAVQLIAVLKQELAQQDLSEEELSALIDQVSGQMGVRLDEKRKKQVIALLMKLKNTDLDVEGLAEQAAGLYEQVSDVLDRLNLRPEKAKGVLEQLDLQPEKAQGVLERLVQWIRSLLNQK